jgi:hypothetical protein
MSTTKGGSKEDSSSNGVI